VGPTNFFIALDTNCSAILPDYTSMVVVHDACSGMTRLIQSAAPGTVLAAGTYQVALSADDYNGNTNTLYFVVNVADTNLPVIVMQPTDTTNAIGSAASFNVTATSCSVLTYQWFKATNALASQTNATLGINPVAVTNAGTYHVVVSSVAGATVSRDAALTVPFQVPVIDSKSMLVDGSFQMNFHAAPGQPYTILGSDDVTAPIPGWSVVTSGTFGPDGTATFNDNAVSTHAHRYFTVRSP
jgi:hypothetical protein